MAADWNLGDGVPATAVDLSSKVDRMYDGAKLGDIAVGILAFTDDNFTDGDRTLEFDDIVDFRRADTTGVSNGADSIYCISMS